MLDHFNQLDEDRRRLVVREDIKQWNQLLAEKAHDAGVITNEEFAVFQNAGYMGLYGQYRIVTSPNAQNIWKEKKSFERKGN